MTTNEQDARALTYLAMRLRANTLNAGPWDEPGTWASVKKLIGQNLAISIERVCHNAADPKAKTPGAIHRTFTPPGPSLETGKHPQPPRREEVCKRDGHEGYRADNCAGCNAERLADEPLAPERRAQPADPTAGANLARAAAGLPIKSEPTKESA